MLTDVHVPSVTSMIYYIQPGMKCTPNVRISHYIRMHLRTYINYCMYGQNLRVKIFMILEFHDNFSIENFAN